VPSTSTKYRWPEAASLIVVLLLIAPLLPSVMRENDQASLVRGAYEIAFLGRSPLGADLYRYDKVFGSYLTLAGVYKLLPRVDPVTSANLFQLVLWIGATTALLLRSTTLPGIARALLLATMLSTTWILNIPFFSPAALSAYTMVLAFLVPARGWRGLIGEALLVFMATSLRADAVLALPFLVWSKSPRTELLNFITGPRTIAVAIAGVAALALGPAVAGGWTVFATPPHIIPKVLLAYTIFGLGPAALTFAYVVVVLAWAASRRGARGWYFLGLASFGLPLAYYGPQLLSPRYLLLMVVVTLCAFTTRRISTLLRFLWPNRLRIAMAAVALVVAIVPLAVGLQLPEITSPRITVSRATTYPSADGHWPMGAVAGFAYSARSHSQVSIDHNQDIYQAARSTEYRSSCNGRVPLLRTPMVAYLELALTIEGLRAEVIDHAGQQGCETAYADLRSLTHEWLHPFEPDASPKELPRLRVVSPPVTNQPIVLIGDEDDPLLGRELASLRDQFQGREFEVLFRRPEVISAQPGSLYRVVAPNDFLAGAICGGMRQHLPTHPGSGLYAAEYATNRADCALELPSGRDILVAHTVLASYMTLH
jgi:hypothetical protein